MFNLSFVVCICFLCVIYRLVFGTIERRKNYYTKINRYRRADSIFMLQAEPVPSTFIEPTQPTDAEIDALGMLFRNVADSKMEIGWSELKQILDQSMGDGEQFYIYPIITFTFEVML